MTHVFEGEPDDRQSPDVNHLVSRFRPTYRALSSDEKALHDAIKAKAEELERLIVATSQYSSVPGAHAPRYTALAMTSLEQSIMWAIKALTS